MIWSLHAEMFEGIYLDLQGDNMRKSHLDIDQLSPFKLWKQQQIALLEQKVEKVFIFVFFRLSIYMARVVFRTSLTQLASEKIFALLMHFYFLLLQAVRRALVFLLAPSRGQCERKGNGKAVESRSISICFSEQVHLMQYDEASKAS